MNRVRHRWWRYATAIAATLLILFSAEIAAQDSGFDHSCADCHMRDHRAVVGGGELSDSRLTVLAITKLLPGLSVNSATCLECHGTLEQRRRRIVEQEEGLGVPLERGLYIGFASRENHPLGSERRNYDPRAPMGRSAPFSIARTDADSQDRMRGFRETVECAGCHSVHAYDLRVGDTRDGRVVCLSCHDPSYYGFQAHITPSCGDCHQQHNAPGPNLTREMDADALCAACHEGSGRMAMNRVDPSLSGPPTHADLRPGRCSDCHKIHGDPGGG